MYLARFSTIIQAPLPAFLIDIYVNFLPSLFSAFLSCFVRSTVWVKFTRCHPHYQCYDYVN